MTEQGERIDAMRSQIEAQSAQIEAMKHALAAQENDYRALRHAVGLDTLDRQRAGNVKAGNATASALPMPGAGAQSAGQTPDQPVGQAPERDTGPPAVAPIFEQPGVLTPRGKLVVEPSYQFGYSSANRVSLIGYTVIPAILIGLIDAREVKTTTHTAALAMRYGLTNRLELELRVPYLYNHTDTVSREIFTGSAQDNVFTSSGHGLGDVEATARYQINDGGADRPYYIGWLRFKSRTGTDPFEVVTDCVTRCVQNATGTGLPLEVPTGSGFYSLQPGLTWLYPSDPVVFFGNLSYLHNFPRRGVSRNVLLAGKEYLGKVSVGDVVDVSLGMGFALNDKASISLGYDQSFIGITKQNNKTVAGSAKSVLGTLLIGGSYRLNEKRTLNFALGVGATRDTPDVTVTVRVPTMY
ncbi:acetate kinase [Rhodanobacter sp. Col0626]|uniref:acetate kinase n=1 Tax=Rhodanobacter sp. Col0626 TaxID=3415679 RepID=UPI003CF1E917